MYKCNIYNNLLHKSKCSTTLSGTGITFHVISIRSGVYKTDIVKNLNIYMARFGGHSILGYQVLN